MAQLTADSNVVLKLQLGEKGTRRIELRKLWDVTKATVSYQYVADLALKFGAPQGKKPDSYEVAITYVDVDGDIITISTDTELFDAFDQFVNTNPPVLRATATIKRVDNKKKIVQKKNLAVVLNDDSTNSALLSSSAVMGVIDPKINQVQNIMESFVFTLSTAIETLQQHVGKLDSPTTSSSARTALTTTAVTSNAAVAGRDTTPQTSFVGTSNETSRDNATNDEVVDVLLKDVISKIASKLDDSDTASMPDSKVSSEAELVKRELETSHTSKEGDVLKQLVSPKSAEQPESSLNEGLSFPKTADTSVLLKIDEPVVIDDSKYGDELASPQSTEKSETALKLDAPKNTVLPAGFDPNFLHGRHTCDGCLRTPILGIRYHAINLPDYDLCSNCVSNYQGTDIIFEPAELDRDRSLQERWKRREARLSRQAELRRGFVHPGRCYSFRHQIKNINEDINANFKEAVFRSLYDANPKSLPPFATFTGKSEPHVAASASPKKPEATEAPEKVSDVTNAPVKNSVVIDVPEKEYVAVGTASISPIADASNKESVNTDISEEQPTNTLNTATIAYIESLSVESTVDAESIQVVSKIKGIPSDEESIAKTEPEEEDSGVVSLLKVPEMNERAVVVPSEIEGSSIIDTCEADEASITSAQIKKKTVLVKEVSDGSFSHDAEGSGDIAMAIGTTLDNFALSIDDIVSDFDKSGTISSNSSMSEPEVNFEEEKANVTSGSAFRGELYCEDPTRAGATILPSLDTQNEDKFESDGDISDDEWQILETEGQIAHDEMIARAAQLIGSALFQSDMSRSADEALHRTSETPPSKLKMSGSSVSVLSTAGSVASSPSSCVSSKSSVNGTSSVASSAIPSVSSAMSSHYSPFLYSRWEPELRHLHELGFLDDRRSLNALECLEAANIGVDSTDPVTVNDVVNLLLSGRE